jgi:hypothetical protein
MVLPFHFAKSQLYVERSCVDEDCIMGPQKKKRHRLRQATCCTMRRSAPLEGLVKHGLGWIHGFIPSSPLLFKRTVRRPELRKIVPFANTTIHELGNAQNSPTLLSDVPDAMRRLGPRRGRGLD